MKINELIFFKLKCSYLVYPLSTGQTDGNYFDHRIRILKKDKAEYNVYDKKYLIIKREILKNFNLELLKKSKNFDENYNYKNTRNFLIQFIRSQKIISSTEFLKKILNLNLIWIHNLEISYLIRKAMDQIDHEDIITCLLISDINSLSYLNWEEFEWFNHPFYQKYKKKFSKFRRYFKETNPLRDKDIDLNFHNLAICKIIDEEKIKNKKKSPKDFDSDYKDYYFAKNSKQHIEFLKFNRDILKKRELKIKEYKDNILKEFGILSGNKKWKNENILYENLKVILNNKINIFREFSNTTLKNLRLDVYFELGGKKYGIEYQGKQHYEPVKFFGGKSAFKKRVKLDSLKKMRCKRSNINLIEFKFDECIKKSSIIQKLKKNGINLKGGKYNG